MISRSCCPGRTSIVDSRSGPTPKRLKMRLKPGSWVPKGIGLCRTEHMFFAADRIDVMRAMILSESKEERQTFLDQLLIFQHDDILELFKVMDGLPVTIRLLDPPLHEFLPQTEEDINALADRIGKPADKIREIAGRLKEVNPMLGFRGCRLSVVYPEITEMQVKAIISAAVDATEQGYKPLPEIMIPLVINVREIRLITADHRHGHPRGTEREEHFHPLQDRHHDGNTPGHSGCTPPGTGGRVYELWHQ